jgi:hypothetical protein
LNFKNKNYQKKNILKFYENSENPYEQGSPRGCRWSVAPLEKNFLKNISFGPPYEISIEFWQKPLKNYDFC